MTATLTKFTNGDILTRHKLPSEGIEHLDLEVPILTGAQAQGDVLILPVAEIADRGTAIPKAGVTVVSGETSGGNAHILHALDGECFWRSAANQALTQGWVTVPDGCSATLVHTEEHNVIGIGAGTYELRRQREFAGEWQRVAD
jgi:hypothetical protein